MANKILADLIGTLRSTFKIATVLLKDSSGNLDVRNKTDTAHAEIGVSGVTINGSSSGNTKLVAAESAAGVYVLPEDDGASGEALVTDGAGNLSWQSASSQEAVQRSWFGV